jgi:hypothetical protein
VGHRETEPEMETFTDTDKLNNNNGRQRWMTRNCYSQTSLSVLYRSCNNSTGPKKACNVRRLTMERPKTQHNVCLV